MDVAPTVVDEVEPTGFASRLRELIGEESVSRFAARVGLGDNLVRKYLEGATPGLDKVVRICEAKSVSIEWLALGRGEREAPARLTKTAAMRYRRRKTDDAGYNAAQSEDRELLEADDGRQFVLLPRYDIRVSAGGGAIVHSEQIVDYYAFNKRWFDERVAIPPSQALLLEVHGDSMEPDLHDGDLVLVDTGNTTFASNAIYVILVNGALLIKRVSSRLDGRVEIRSSNEQYGVETLSPEEAQQLVVVGRARRVISERRLP